MKNRKELERIAKRVRQNIIEMTYHSGVKGGHLGGCLSLAEILAVLYGNIMKYDIKKYSMPERDRLIISKAHAAMAQYAILNEVGFISDEDIQGAMHGESLFYEHPKMSLENGIEFSGGSLGQGLSLGMGTALALKKKGICAKVFVILGDGECDEGQIWEAATAIAHFNLSNVTVIVDMNGLQYDGDSKIIMNLGNVEMRWKSMGYHVRIIDGHDVEDIQKALLLETNSPKVVLAKTIKGKGVSFAENQVQWHTGRLTEELYEEALANLNDRNK